MHMGLLLGAKIPVLSIHPKMIISQLNKDVNKDMKYSIVNFRENFGSK